MGLHYLALLVTLLSYTSGYNVERIDFKQLMQHAEAIEVNQLVTELNQVNGYYTYDNVGYSFPSDPDAKRNVSEMIADKGYPVENHDVQTTDGYILSIQRIPKGINDSNSVSGRPAILLFHGLFSASTQWVMNYPEQSLGYLLADAGYDVWMGNFRGNVYSKRHVKYNPKQSEFWDFSWQEMAEFDLPASIDYVRKVTGQDKIFYCGHSMGTTAMFALLSEKPEYNDKLKAVIAMAPGGNVTHITSPIRIIAPFAKDLKFLLDLIGENEFLPTDAFIGVLADLVCGPKSFKPLCHNVVFLLLESLDETEAHLNETRMDVYFNHFPAGTSSRTVIHYGLNIVAAQFQKYDFGKKENLVKYGQEHPPIYDVNKITAPVGLYSSDADDMADPWDVADLAAQIHNQLEWYKVPCPHWGHFDYILGIDAKTCVYDKVIQTLNSIK